MHTIYSPINDAKQYTDVHTVFTVLVSDSHIEVMRGTEPSSGLETSYNRPIEKRHRMETHCYLREGDALDDELMQTLLGAAMDTQKKRAEQQESEEQQRQEGEKRKWDQARGRFMLLRWSLEGTSDLRTGESLDEYVERQTPASCDESLASWRLTQEFFAPVMAFRAAQVKLMDPSAKPGTDLLTISGGTNKLLQWYRRWETAGKPQA